MLHLLVLVIFSKPLNSQNFPETFKFGAATASYQIEGGWNVGGKSENIWDRLTHAHPELITNHSNGDVACDSYNLWMNDIEMLHRVGVYHYRFSLSWTRLLPSGFANKVSGDGVAYYNRLIDGLVRAGIEPMVTLYHWDLPQALQDLGGWTNPTLADYFEAYAKVCFDLFGDRVKTWITINEPASFCIGAYENDNNAPPFHNKSSGLSLYLCGKTVLLAHAKAYRLYNFSYKKKQAGKVGITIDSTWAEPKTPRPEDIVAAQRELQMSFGWWAHPIFSITGDYPRVMKERIAANSKKENYPTSRLADLSFQEISFIRGTADFLGLNHYHTWLIEDFKWPDKGASFRKDKGTAGTPPFPKIAPWGFRKLLNWIQNEYGGVEVIVTENGFGDKGGVEDDDRIDFLKAFLHELLLAVEQDHCNVTGYTVWSLMDNMEWRDGYTIKFGLFQVDFSNPVRPRIAKKSVEFYRNVIKTRKLFHK